MKYPFTVYQTQVEGHVFWVAECPALNGCVGQGETADEALKELELNETAWLETAKEYGIAIPDIPCEQMNPYSGKFTVRVSPQVHQTAVELAKKQGISLNQYVNDAIVAQNSCLVSMSAVLPAVTEIVDKIKMLASTPVTKSFSDSSTVFQYRPDYNTQIVQVAAS